MPRGKRNGRKRSQAAAKGHATRKRRAKAIEAAQSFKHYYEAGSEWSEPDRPVFDWDRESGWEPPGGWQGDELAEEISYMTHEEKIDFLEWLAEELDTTISDLFEMMYP